MEIFLMQFREKNLNINAHEVRHLFYFNIYIYIYTSQHSQCVPVRVGYQVAAYTRAYKVNVEVGSFVRRCAFAVLG